MEPEGYMFAIAAPTVSGTQRDYLEGYLAGVQGLVDHLVTGETAPRPEETAGLVTATHAAAAPESAYLGASAEVPEAVERRSHARGEVEKLDESQLTWGLQAINVERSELTGRGIRVAVLDTGIDTGHPDVRNREIVTKSFVPGEQIQDRQGHGTHTSGTATGPEHPARLPRYGVATEATLYMGKVLGDDGSGQDGWILNGINWALANDCRVISMSLGAPRPPVQAYRELGRRALDQGAIIVAAAGNDSRRSQGRIAPDQRARELRDHHRRRGAQRGSHRRGLLERRQDRGGRARRPGALLLPAADSLPAYERYEHGDTACGRRRGDADAAPPAGDRPADLDRADGDDDAARRAGLRRGQRPRTSADVARAAGARAEPQRRQSARAGADTGIPAQPQLQQSACARRRHRGRSRGARLSTLPLSAGVHSPCPRRRRPEGELVEMVPSDVIVVVKTEFLHEINRIVADLEIAGLHVEKVLPKINTVTGSAPASQLEKIRSVKGWPSWRRPESTACPRQSPRSSSRHAPLRGRVHSRARPLHFFEER